MNHIADTKEYLSLTDAEKFCSYSGAYLRLRIRQGKLKGVKFGRNWVTKKEWLDEYLRKVNNDQPRLSGQEMTAVKAPINPPAESPIQLLGLRFGLAATLVFILLAAGIVFGADNPRVLLQDVKAESFG